MSQNQTNAPVSCDTTEPTAGNVSVSIWLLVIFGALFFGSQLYLSERAGGFEEQVYTPFHSTNEIAAANPQNPEEKFIAMGKDIFDKTCAACHQPNGLGKDGVAPPLAGSEWVQASGPFRICHVVLYGLTGPITVKGKEFNLNMVPWKDVYDDEHLAAVLSYVRNTWGNKGTFVKPEEIAKARKEGHSGPETAPELLALPEMTPGK